MHWHNFHINIFVHLTYRLNPTYILGGEMPKIIKELHYYISNDNLMILFLCNIVSSYIGNFCQIKDVLLLSTLCGMMAILGNSKAVEHGIFGHIIQG
jgi:hypothetical protein